MEAPLRGTVIVAETRAPVRDYVRGLLGRALPGVSQVCASGGAAAMEVIDSLGAVSSDETGPVVVVSGVRMSELDGLDIAEHAWRCASPVSVVLLCGFPTEAERERARELEATLIEDPSGFGRLAEIVERLLVSTRPTIH